MCFKDCIMHKTLITGYSFNDPVHPKTAFLDTAISSCGQCTQLLSFRHEQLRAANSELAADWLITYVITRGEMAGQENISLSAEECGVFIDLWEENPCLWHPASQGYKDRNRKLTARIAIADAMGTGWTEGMLRQFA